jgi:hypothetical protein
MALLWLAQRYLRRGGEAMLFFFDLLASSSCLYALIEVRGVVTASGTTDATILAGMTGVPAILWALLWGALSLSLLALTARAAWRDAS